MAFCELIVTLGNDCIQTFTQVIIYTGWYDVVEINYLVVGHTHEDVDQMFSAFWNHLKSREVETLEEAIDALINAYSQPKIILTKKVYDFKAALTPHMRVMHGQTTPSGFRFSRNPEDGCVGFQARYAFDKGVCLRVR